MFNRNKEQKTRHKKGRKKCGEGGDQKHGQILPRPGFPRG